jgi:hypothetical protein
MRVNALKALPVLRYLLADEGVEPPYVPFSTGWKVFQAFLKVPADSTGDVAGFQTSWLREKPDAPVFEVLFCRQLTDRDQPGGPLMRIVALQFLFEQARADLGEVEVWSKDYPSLDRFLDDVERRPEFEYAMEAEPSLGEAILVEEDEPEPAA